MIGYYNVSVILTYVALMSSVAGIILAMKGNVFLALLCLIFAGVCDLFDGKVARATKRNDDEKAFGVQIDSLCDLVGFGILPVVICREMGVNGIAGNIILVVFVLAAVIRLGYFNVTELKRQKESNGGRKYYQGLPVTAIALLLPLIGIMKPWLGERFVLILSIFMLAIAILFILDIRVKKLQV